MNARETQGTIDVLHNDALCEWAAHTTAPCSISPNDTQPHPTGLDVFRVGCVCGEGAEAAA